MGYDRTFGDSRQRIHTIGGMVLIEGPAPDRTVAGDTLVSCMFDAAKFVSASIEAHRGNVSIQTEKEDTGVWFGGVNHAAFTLEDLLEAVTVAKSEG